MSLDLISCEAMVGRWEEGREEGGEGREEGGEGRERARTRKRRVKKQGGAHEARKGKRKRVEDEKELKRTR